MVTRNHDPPTLYLSTPSPEPSPRGSKLYSDYDAEDEDSMDPMDTSGDEIPLSEPVSLSQTSLQATGPYCPRIPTLQEILQNKSPPPWTLAAFTAHLSQNHCLENLEFIKEAERYRQSYADVTPETSTQPDSEAFRDLRARWVRLLEAYIRPNAPREVNLPANVRDALVAMPNDVEPPKPASLDPAIERIIELMNESILLDFISHHTPQRPASTGIEGGDEDDRHTRRSTEHRRQRSQSSRRKHSPVGDILAGAARGHRPRDLINLGHHRHPPQIHSGSGASGEQALTDDTGSTGSPTNSPMTPPTTPPSSDLGGRSPNQPHPNSNTWRRVFKNMGKHRTRES